MAEYLKQLQKCAHEMQLKLAPFVEFHKKMQESLRPIMAFHERVRNSIEQFAETQRRITIAIKPVLAGLSEYFKGLPEKTRNALLTLGKQGWYIDFEMPSPVVWKLEKMLENGESQKAEQALIEYFKKRSKNIYEELRADYPHRDKVIKAAFDAHARGEYELSVPVFLAQADGICQERTSIQLFKTKKSKGGIKKPATADIAESIAGDVLRFALMAPLTSVLPILYNEEERGKNFCGLNRHQVLHGISVDYGTEVNSLKAISLLNYIAQILNPPKE